MPIGVSLKVEGGLRQALGHLGLHAQHRLRAVGDDEVAGAWSVDDDAELALARPLGRDGEAQALGGAEAALGGDLRELPLGGVRYGQHALRPLRGEGRGRGEVEHLLRLPGALGAVVKRTMPMKRPCSP